MVLPLHLCLTFVHLAPVDYRLNRVLISAGRARGEANALQPGYFKGGSISTSMYPTIWWSVFNPLTSNPLFLSRNHLESGWLLILPCMVSTKGSPIKIHASIHVAAPKSGILPISRKRTPPFPLKMFFFSFASLFCPPPIKGVVPKRHSHGSTLGPSFVNSRSHAPVDPGAGEPPGGAAAGEKRRSEEVGGRDPSWLFNPLRKLGVHITIKTMGVHRFTPPLIIILVIIISRNHSGQAELFAVCKLALRPQKGKRDASGKVEQLNPPMTLTFAACSPPIGMSGESSTNTKAGRQH